MNIIARRKIWYLLSTILILPGIIGLFLWGLPTGIDFSGGTLLDIQFQETVQKDKIEEVLTKTEISGTHVQPGEENSFIIRMPEESNEILEKLKINLAEIGEYQQNRLETVGPTVSNSLKNRAIIAVVIASFAIIIFIAIAFYKVPKPASSWKFGVCAVLALIHDILFVVGGFAILGHFFGYEVNSLFITALLTIMGFSVHDTIVVFDRIRENLIKSPSLGFEENINNSILQTLNRSLNTSFTLLIVLLAIFLSGGVTLHQFMLALLLGITIGTYSSIFFAPSILASWQGWSMRRKEQKRLLERPTEA